MPGWWDFSPLTRRGWHPRQRDQTSLANSEELKPVTSGTPGARYEGCPRIVWMAVLMTPRRSVGRKGDGSNTENARLTGSCDQKVVSHESERRG